jgi:hypothetical protein
VFEDNNGPWVKISPLPDPIPLPEPGPTCDAACWQEKVNALLEETPLACTVRTANN